MRTSFVYKTSRLVRISLLINALNKRVLLFSEESYFIKAIENFFPVFAYPDINTRGVEKILYSYANPQLRLGFANKENVFYCLIVMRKFETILKYLKWYLCQISCTNHAIIC